MQKLDLIISGALTSASASPSRDLHHHGQVHLLSRLVELLTSPCSLAPLFPTESSLRIHRRGWGSSRHFPLASPSLKGVSYSGKYTASFYIVGVALTYSVLRAGGGRGLSRHCYSGEPAARHGSRDIRYLPALQQRHSERRAEKKTRRKPRKPHIPPPPANAVAAAATAAPETT